MSTLLEEPIHLGPVQRLRHTCAAVRLSFVWFGTRKTLTTEQRAQAAESFGAEGQFLSAGKKLIDTRDPAFKAVTGVRSRIVSYWKGVSLPYPEPGIRLIRQEDVAAFNQHLTLLEAELDEAVEQLNERYGALKSAARALLGRLYNASDYPETLRGLFQVAWDFPSVEPPQYLRQVSPELYRQECQRVAARFDEAVQLAEQAFLEEFSKLVGHLTERLSGQEDGQPKIFRDSAVENLTEFFKRFRRLNIGSSQELDQLVNQAQQVVRGVEPQTLRANQGRRQEVGAQLAGVQSALDGLLVERPRRNILRRAKETEGFYMQLLVRPDGVIRCLYDELLDLSAFGALLIVRASDVEPNRAGQWLADLGAVHGPLLGPFAQRSQALAAERVWLETHWL